jgi:hypothetical protein
MARLTTIVGVGGCGIAGTLTAIAITQSTSLVFSAFCVSVIVGGVLPTVGWYAGFGAVLGLFATVVLGLNYQYWPLITLSGVTLAFVHLLVTSWRTHAERGTRRVLSCASGRAEAEEYAEDDSRQCKGNKSLIVMGAVTLILSPVAAVCVAFLIVGPSIVGSFFFWKTIVLGVIVGAVLFLGFAVAELCQRSTHKRRRRKADISDLGK